MIQSVSPGRALDVSNILRAKYSGNEIALPLKGSAFTYAKFKHVTGVPSGQAGQGYSITKLKVLDTLIDRLVRIKGQQVIRPETEKVSRSAESMDALIENYRKELQSALARSSQYAPPVQTSGALFSFMV